MLASITPLGERSRGSNWTLTATMYIAAATAGGAAVGALSGALGLLALGTASVRLRLALVAVAIVVGLAWEVSGRSLPGPRRQVDERWLDGYRGWVYGAGFGVQLGAGVATVVVSSAVYAVLITAFASASVEGGLAIGAAAGALRGITVLAGAGVRTPQALVRLHRSMRRLHAPARAASLCAQLVIAGLATLAVVI